MATRTKPNRAGRRRGGGRSQPGGPASIVSRVTGMLGGGGAGGRGRRSGGAGGGLASKATGFVRGFMSSGGSAKSRRGRRR